MLRETQSLEKQTFTDVVREVWSQIIVGTQLL